jgi:transcriptional regulator with XRE-family HTH domain
MDVAPYERAHIAGELRDALAASGLTQEAFARLLGTSRSRLSAYLNARTIPSAVLYQRALRLAAGLRSARLRGWMIPDRTAAEVDEALNAGDELWAFKLVVQARDQLATMIRTGDEASAAWLVRTRPISDSRYDVLLAALVEHEFGRQGCACTPEWTKDRRLEESWIQPNLRRGPDWTREHTPRWLADRGVFISDHDLMTA